MKIKWWGHACFQITGAGKTILTDPYDESVGYRPVDTQADIVTVSHDHFDHNAVDLLPGEPEVVNTPGDWEGEDLKITGVSSYHDQEQGASRGENIIFLMELAGKKICHLGDLGHQLDQEQVKGLKGIDILFIPVGGYYTIDAEEAYKVCQALEPGIIIPMHYKTDVLDFPISGVDDFLNNFAPAEINKTGQSELEINDIPGKRQVYILDYVGQ